MWSKPPFVMNWHISFLFDDVIPQKPRCNNDSLSCHSNEMFILEQNLRTVTCVPEWYVLMSLDQSIKLERCAHLVRGWLFDSTLLWIIRISILSLGFYLFWNVFWGMKWKPSKGWISLITCWTDKVIHEKYDDLLNRVDNVSVILKCPPRRVNTYVRALFSLREFLQHST